MKGLTTAQIDTTSFVGGSPGVEVLQVIEENPTIDLIVTGSQGRTGIKRVLLGSVAETIVRHAAALSSSHVASNTR